MIPPLVIRRLRGLQDYRATWEVMRRFTDDRGPNTPDELWLLEHHPVFTLGQAGRREHCFDLGEVPLIQTDRGGQVTYHGPGQLVVYIMLDLRRAGLGVKRLVELMEGAVVELLAAYGIVAATRAGAPGVYVEEAKIASLGLRVRRGCSYHGLALNCTTDLSAFGRIDPCGYPGLAVTRMADFVSVPGLAIVGDALAQRLAFRLGAALSADVVESTPG